MAARRAVLTRALAAFALLAALAALLAFAGACARPAPLAHASTCERCHGVHFAALGTCAGCHRGDPRAARANVAHAGLLRGAAAAWRMEGSPALVAGTRLRDALGCRRCHVTGGRGNAWAISLDRVVARRDPDSLRAAIRHPATFMPDFALSDEQAQQLIAVLLHDAGADRGENRYVVRFTTGATHAPDPFSASCGPCHRALTVQGPLGWGTSGPNLTGLFGEFYPPRAGRRWDAERLRRWVRNPRADDSTSTMPPVVIREGDLAGVVATLAASPSR